jgi:hypothetical protein
MKSREKSEIGEFRKEKRTFLPQNNPVFSTRSCQNFNFAVLLDFHLPPCGFSRERG